MTHSLEEIHDRLVAGIEGLVSSDEWWAMLEVSARFHNYSSGGINNKLLIYLQCPEATRVAGYRAWQRFGRQVRKGERGIQILAPCRKRVNKVTSEGEQNEGARVEVLSGFRVVHVFDTLSRDLRDSWRRFTFDRSQTEGAELPEVAPRRLNGEVPVHSMSPKPSV